MCQTIRPRGEVFASVDDNVDGEIDVESGFLEFAATETFVATTRLAEAMVDCVRFVYK